MPHSSSTPFTNSTPIPQVPPDSPTDPNADQTSLLSAGRTDSAPNLATAPLTTTQCFISSLGR
ncbi:MAG: hypothetical protein HC795_00975 [Coleofasciculaceae cyanobacterium RL_1_1]|nr:hypothetical protein [Coleofasciculaceae cyanobacterium RL_1_1]